MEIKLAGCNIDRDTLREWADWFRSMLDEIDSENAEEITGDALDALRRRGRALLAADNLTPETISAAYARISRDPRPVDQIRDEARHWVGKARRSNRRIVFGMGHASIAEHAVFNLDIIGVSRFLAEFIQHHRLCSFTEKSQRYIRLGRDYMIPEEIRRTGLEERYRSFMETVFQRYSRICDILVSSGRLPEDKAGEDARYILPLGVTTQMGMTANARNIEYLLQRAAASPLDEFRRFGEQLYGILEGTAPSLIKYVKPTPFLADMQKRWRNRLPRRKKRSPAADEPLVRLTESTDDADTRVREAIEMRLWGTVGRDGAAEENSDAQAFFREVFRFMTPWSPAPRELEYATLRYELIISAAAFAQLKRHRMATITAGPYDPSLGLTIPPSFNGTAAEELLRKSAAEAEKLYQTLGEAFPAAGPYVLLSAHRRRMMMQLNARELIHLARLREDGHAQWDIRALTAEMVRLAREKMPLCMMLACGKDAFEERYRAAYGDNPPETLPTGAT